MNRLLGEVLEAQTYSVEELKKADEALKLIDVLVNNYRFSSAIRFSMFLNIDSGKFGQEGKLYFVFSTREGVNKKHFDLVFVCSNGVICSTCSEYLEYGMYDRHILALFINGFISLSPLHQCSSYWLRASTDTSKTYTLVKNWFHTSHERNVKCQEIVYNSSCCFNSAYILTKSAYSELQSVEELFSLEKAMNSINPAVVKACSARDECRSYLFDMFKWNIHTDPDCLMQLRLLHGECRDKLQQSSKKSDGQAFTRSSRQTTKRMTGYGTTSSSKKAKFTRNDTDDAEITTSTPKSPEHTAGQSIIGQIFSTFGWNSPQPK